MSKDESELIVLGFAQWVIFTSPEFLFKNYAFSIISLL
jgi:hypothetical protein